LPGPVRCRTRLFLARGQGRRFLPGLLSSPCGPTVPGGRARRRPLCRWAGCRGWHGGPKPTPRHAAAGQHLLDGGSPDPGRASRSPAVGAGVERGGVAAGTWGGCLRAVPGWAEPRRAWRVSSSYDTVSANDGQAAITRAISVGSATATLAARLATLPATSSAHRKTPPPRPVLRPARPVASRTQRGDRHAASRGAGSGIVARIAAPRRRRENWFQVIDLDDQI
jgi:hypothetical protein